MLQTQPINLSAGLEPIQVSTPPTSTTPAPPAASAAPATSPKPGSIDLSAGLEPISSVATQTTPPEQPGILSRAWDATKQYGENLVSPVVSAGKSLVTPPQDHKEELAYAYGGGYPALQAYRAARKVIGSLESTIKAPVEHYNQAKVDFNRGIQDLQNKDYRNLASDAASTSADIMGTVSPGTSFVTDRAREFSEGARPGGDLVTPTVKTALDAGTAALLESGGVGGEATEEEAAATPNTPTAKTPGIVKQIRKGADVAQPEAEQALRTGVKAGGKEAGLSTVQPQSLRTIVEEPIHTLDASSKALYRQIDQAAGTDFKALNEKLDNTEYQIRQLTETEEDLAKEGALEKSRTAIMEKIESAKQQAKAAGVDPTTLDRADAQFRRARALSDVETKVFKNPNIVKGNQAMGTPETVDVDSAVKALQKLQDSTKYGGSRLELALGKNGASQLLKDLYDAQRVGTKALSRQQFAKWTARIVGLGTAEELIRHAWQQ